MKHQKSVFKAFSLVSQLGISMIVPVCMCTLLGVFLEEQFEISLTVPLIILGIFAGARNVYALVSQVAKEMAAEKDEDE